MKSSVVRDRSAPLIVSTMVVDGGDTSIAIDAYEDCDRIDLIVFGKTIALTHYEAGRLAGYLKLACARGTRST